MPAYVSPTISDLQQMRAGLFFDSTSAPTLAAAQGFLADANNESIGALRQIGYTDEEISEILGDVPAELASWLRSFTLYSAMAEVWSVLPGFGENPWKTRADDLRAEILKQPERYLGGIPMPEAWAAKPTAAGKHTRRFRGEFDIYLRNSGGF